MGASKMKNKFHIEHWQIISIYMILCDMVVACGAYFCALWIRFDCQFQLIPEELLFSYARFIPFYAILTVIVYRCFRLYQSIWRFASYNELTRIIGASVVLTFLHILLSVTIFQRMPIIYYVFGAMIQFGVTTAIRFSYRFVLLEREKRYTIENSIQENNVMIIGAGTAGAMLIREINYSRKMRDRVVCLIDDNSNKWNRFVEGVPVVGGRDSILAMVEKYHVNKIYVAIPGAPDKEKREIYNVCKETGCELKTIPSVYQLVNGQITTGNLKEVAVEDLLGREPIQVDMKEIFHQLNEKVVMVTGGGGSIGSELVRQLAAHNPKQIIIFEVYENSAYEIQQEIKKKYPEINLTVLIGSVRDSRRMMQVFETYHPQIVFHAAAHKHVPLMEDSPNESIKNNVMGTYKTAYAAMVNGCERFVLISTDKAVNPTNIMGASKRLCEMVIQSFDRMIKEGTPEKLPLLYEHSEEEGQYPLPEHIKTEFVAVRFGNVLGSNGSVIPLFKKQIAAGGPVTVTHPDIIRYFMTIPEAVSLVLQAGTYAHGGEIFVLDMGEPVKIDTLARNLIQLSGLKPDIDIPIVYSGLRPGEKLYEEKLMEEEGLKKTPNQLIHIGCPIPFDVGEFLEELQELMEVSYRNTPDIREYVKKVVGTYHPA